MPGVCVSDESVQEMAAELVQLGLISEVGIDVCVLVKACRHCVGVIL